MTRWLWYAAGAVSGVVAAFILWVWLDEEGQLGG